MSARDLSELRREVDRLDDAMLDLLVERMAVVRDIASLKGDRDAGRLALRPAREAAILRRLVARADGRFPTASLLQMWRELLGATTSSQAPLRLVAWDRDGGSAVRDVARRHFGTLAPVRGAASAEEALRQLLGGEAQIALLPLPEEADRWWRCLLSGDTGRLRVISRLPFLDGPGRPQALAVAALDPEPSGDDLSLLVIETLEESGPVALERSLAAAGLQPRRLATQPGEQAGSLLHLFELAGFHGPHTPLPATALGAPGSGILRATPVGGYPRPLSEAEPD